VKTKKAQAMPAQPRAVGRRERNKQEKLDRIVAAARELFDTYGVDAVSTQQIADKADIGTGTLFLYAKNKGELFLMVQNSSYVEALEQGRAEAEKAPGALEAVMAIIRSVVECNRTHVENGQTYLRELVFGDPEEPNHREAISLTLKTEEAIAAVLGRDKRIKLGDAATLAQIVSAIMFISMAATINAAHTVDEIIEEIAGRVRVMLQR
jgi:TetR/AcrR family transcriptional regulator